MMAPTLTLTLALSVLFSVRSPLVDTADAQATVPAVPPAAVAANEALSGAAPMVDGVIVLDSGDNASSWTAEASPGATARVIHGLGRQGGAVGLSYDLGQGRNHVIARLPVSVDLPANYMFVLAWRGTAAVNNIEIKFVSGDNVWWRRLDEFQFPTQWKDLRVSKQRIEFAWGPADGGMPVHVDAIEVAVVAGEGGKGEIWIDEVRLEPRSVAAVQPPTFSVSSNSDAVRLLTDKKSTSTWRSDAADREPTITMDFHQTEELGGLAVTQAPDGFSAAYVVEASRDGRQWEEVRRFTRSNGGVDYVYLPEVYARYLRLRWQLPEGAHAAVSLIRLQPFAFSASPNGLFAGIAVDSEPGWFPRYFAGEQSMWTVVGASGDDNEALVNEDGTVEVAAGAFTLEPFLWRDGGLRGWREARSTVSLEDGDLPIPTVARRDGNLDLRITAFASGKAGASTLYVRYRTHAAKAVMLRLNLAVRPFQVLPPWQTLNRQGGVTSIARISREDSTIAVDGYRVIAVTPPSAFGAAPFEAGDITTFLAQGRVPPDQTVEDPFAHASAVLAWDLSLAAGETRDVWVAVPWSTDSAVVSLPVAGVPAQSAAGKIAANQSAASSAAVADENLGPEALLEVTKQQWRDQLGRVPLVFPGEAEELVRSLRTNLAYVLINRDGPAIQPGSRTYERSWIRDGAMSCGAMLGMGLEVEVKDFLRWYAGYIGKDGWAPCCVDARGADPVPEHDSFGQFVWAVAEVWRYTRDEAFVREMWPHVQSVVTRMSGLRATRMTPEYRTPDHRAYFGLLPESISHEGYSARPVHSYWDQVFALRGYADAALLAKVVRDQESAARYAAERDSFAETLRHSIADTMIAHDMDVVPASVELADFDPTSTAVALRLGTESVYPRDALQRSFTRYLENLRARKGQSTRGTGYTAYELRSATALVLLGRGEEAVEVLNTLVADQRPPAWNQWPEISWLWPSEPSFLGDVPHSWIGSTFIYAVRTLLVVEREETLGGDGASLLVGAGIPRRWLADGGEVGATAMPTWFGAITVRIRAGDATTALVEIEAASQPSAVDAASETSPRRFTMPSKGIVVSAPFSVPASGAAVNGATVTGATVTGATVTGATVNGEAARVENNAVRVVRLPATVLFAYKTPMEKTR